jgi:hypothetical protein
MSQKNRHVRQFGARQEQRDRERVTETMWVSSGNWRIAGLKQFLEHAIPTFHGRLALALAIPEKILRAFVL